MEIRTPVELSKLTESLGRAALDFPYGNTTGELTRPTFNRTFDKSCHLVTPRGTGNLSAF